MTGYGMNETRPVLPKSEQIHEFEVEYDNGHPMRASNAKVVLSGFELANIGYFAKIDDFIIWCFENGFPLTKTKMIAPLRIYTIEYLGVQ